MNLLRFPSLSRAPLVRLQRTFQEDYTNAVLIKMHRVFAFFNIAFNAPVGFKSFDAGNKWLQ